MLCVQVDEHLTTFQMTDVLATQCQTNISAADDELRLNREKQQFLAAEPVVDTTAHETDMSTDAIKETLIELNKNSHLLGKQVQTTVSTFQLTTVLGKRSRANSLAVDDELQLNREKRQSLAAKPLADTTAHETEMSIVSVRETFIALNEQSYLLGELVQTTLSTLVNVNNKNTELKTKLDASKRKVSLLCDAIDYLQAHPMSSCSDVGFEPPPSTAVEFCGTSFGEPTVERLNEEGASDTHLCGNQTQTTLSTFQLTTVLGKRIRANLSAVDDELRLNREKQQSLAADPVVDTATHETELSTDLVRETFILLNEQSYLFSKLAQTTLSTLLNVNNKNTELETKLYASKRKVAMLQLRLSLVPRNEEHAVSARCPAVHVVDSNASL